MTFSAETTRMLMYINKHQVNENHLKKKFGETYRLRLKNLEQGHAINYEFEADGITHTIVPGLEGQLFLADYKAERRLTKRERWRERILGFVPGVLVTVVGGLILKWISG